MSGATSAPERRRAGSGTVWRRGAARGLAAFLVVAAMGQAVPFAMNVFGAGLAGTTALKLGWFYTIAFHRVGLRIAGDGGSAAITLTLSVAFLTGTAAAGWLLYRAGGSSVRRLDGGRRVRAIAVVAVALAYAAPIGLVSAAVSLRLSLGTTPIGGAIRVSPVVWQAFALPFVLAVACAGAGAWQGGVSGRTRSRTIAAAGWRMFACAVGLAFVGVLLLAAVRPAGLAAYAHDVASGGPRRAALLLGHHALLLPNQSIDVLAPSMLGCTGLRGVATWIPLLCPGRLPSFGSRGVLATLALLVPVRSGPAPIASGSMGPGYAAFLLVPLVGTVYGGWWGASPAAGRRSLLDGAAAGVVFSALVLVGSWAAGIGEVVAIGGSTSSSTLGPRPLPTALLALGWGVVGGTIGAAVARSQEAGPDAPPPSPTSV